MEKEIKTLKIKLFLENKKRFDTELFLGEEGIKEDYYEITTNANSGASLLGYIPCNPKCKETNKIWKKLTKIGED